MSSVVISGDTSGQITVAAPAVAGSNTLTLLAATATNSVNTLATAVASTSGTSITFSSLPSWVKRITVMFQGVSLSGTAHLLVQLGAGSTAITGYIATSNGTNQASATGGVSSTSGFPIRTAVGAAGIASGHMLLTTLGSNTWISSHSAKDSTTECMWGGGDITLGGTLDRVVITTTNGTDTFDAGTVNILYEG